MSTAPNMKYSAQDIAVALRASGVRMHDPTEEQSRIIQSWPLEPSVVIAGAGSGKTETMSARVLWLVANGYVRPDEILGLTFTRKAAGELALRIRTRLRQLRNAGIGPIDIAVAVSTYHSYAGRVLAENSIRLGIDSDAEPIGEAAAWQIANKIVKSYSTDDGYTFTSSPKTIVDKVMDLSAALGEHNKSTADIRAFTEPLLEKFTAITGKSNAEVREAIETLQERLAILPIVDQYDSYRIERGLLTFNDQMSLAATLVEQFPEISEVERVKYKVVLLDEYQDTSYSQVRFLSHLFGQGHCVTAVGDPNQAIYGWRSASSQTLATFGSTFVGSSSAKCQEFSLLTTWRNDEEILNLANRTIDGINSHAGRGAKVDRLQLRPKAGPGELICGQFETLEMEAAGIAEYFEKLWKDPARLALPESERSSFAVLVRTRKYISGIESALRARGIPVEVVGLGGLIHIPEIADILALLRTLTFPDAGSSLMRLLTGPRLALGARDLAGLGKYARSLTTVDGEPASRSRTLISLLENGDSAAMEADDFTIGSAIEALESIEQAPAKDFSPEGLARLIRFASDLKSLRRQMSGSITDVLITAERFLFLDTEVLVRDGWESGRKHLDKFLDEAAKFQRNGGTLSSFLEWLKIAENEEGGLKPSSVDVTNSAVQILTVHSSKGSEWDVVAIPGFVKGNFPSSGKSSDLWLKNSGSLPIALRGDSSQLQDFEFPRVESAPTFVQVKKALEDQGDYWKARRYEEELRLAYVAFTRARSHLICTASWFGNGQGAVDPSDLFTWISEVAQSHSADSVISAIDKPDTKNPTRENPRTQSWPIDRPIEALIRKSADFVRSAAPISATNLIEAGQKESDIEIAGWMEDADALISEIDSRNRTLEIFLPHRLSVSTLIALKQNPDELALSIRRPMPGHIDKYARRGTEFHLWVEKQFTDPLLFDDSIFDLAPAPEEVPLKELQDKWRASEWGNLRPVDVEVPFETVMAGHLLRGRIDAIYQEGDSYTVVDWKTGRAKSGEELATAAIQLAMYRLAYSKLHSIPLEKISAAFHYVSDGQTIRPADIYSEEELIAILERYHQK